MNNIHPGFDCSYLEKFLALTLRLELVVNRATQDVVNGRPRFRWEFCGLTCPLNSGGYLSGPRSFLDVPPEVADSNQFLHQEFEVLAAVSFMVVVPVEVTSRGLIPLCRIQLNWCASFKVRVVLDKREEPVIRYVQMSEMRGLPRDFVEPS